MIDIQQTDPIIYWNLQALNVMYGHLFVEEKMETEVSLKPQLYGVDTFLMVLEVHKANMALLHFRHMLLHAQMTTLVI